jgi:putative transposase
MTKRAVEEFGLSVTSACRLFGLSRTTYYNQSESKQLERDAPVIEALNGVVEKHPRCGFWKCFNKIRNDG